jgi:hypothetical protein
MADVDRRLQLRLLCMHCLLLQLGSTAAFTAHYCSIPSTILYSSFTALLSIYLCTCLNEFPARLQRGSEFQQLDLKNQQDRSRLRHVQSKANYWGTWRISGSRRPS